MSFRYVTLTGADDSVSPMDLIDISSEFPFVEWGILIGNHDGAARFPSYDWIREQCDIKRRETGMLLNLSLHQCGDFLESIIDGESILPVFSPLFGPIRFARFLAVMPAASGLTTLKRSSRKSWRGVPAIPGSTWKPNCLPMANLIWINAETFSRKFNSTNRFSVERRMR